MQKKRSSSVENDLGAGPSGRIPKAEKLPGTGQEDNLALSHPTDEKSDPYIMT